MKPYLIGGGGVVTLALACLFANLIFSGFNGNISGNSATTSGFGDQHADGSALTKLDNNNAVSISRKKVQKVIKQIFKHCYYPLHVSIINVGAALTRPTIQSFLRSFKLFLYLKN
jgi:hypothetical protein